MNPYQALANAIVELAVKDYKELPEVLRLALERQALMDTTAV